MKKAPQKRGFCLGVIPMDDGGIIQQLILPIVLAILGSSGLSTLIQYLISRRDTRVQDQLKEVKDIIGENQAILARTHILRFADDLRNHGIDYHSEEYYRQQLQDCDTYDRYCESHPGFSNGLTQIANEYIKRSFEELYTKGVKHEQ